MVFEQKCHCCLILNLSCEKVLWRIDLKVLFGWLKTAHNLMRLLKCSAVLNEMPVDVSDMVVACWIPWLLHGSRCHPSLCTTSMPHQAWLTISSSRCLLMPVERHQPRWSCSLPKATRVLLDCLSGKPSQMRLRRSCVQTTSRFLTQPASTPTPWSFVSLRTPSWAKLPLGWIIVLRFEAIRPCYLYMQQWPFEQC